MPRQAAPAPATPGPSAPRHRAPIEPEEPLQVPGQRVFVTPEWLESRPVRARFLRVPQQVTPAYADPVGAAPVAPPRELLHDVRWDSGRRRWAVQAAILLGAVIATLGTGLQEVARPTATGAIAPMFFLALTALMHALLASLRPTQVRLNGMTLSVLRGRRTDVFELLEPHQQIVLRGTPGKRSWSLVLSRLDGAPVEVTARMVDAEVLHPVAAYALAVAEDRSSAREVRFNR